MNNEYNDLLAIFANYNSDILSTCVGYILHFIFSINLSTFGILDFTFKTDLIIKK